MVEPTPLADAPPAVATALLVCVELGILAAKAQMQRRDRDEIRAELARLQRKHLGAVVNTPRQERTRV